MIETREIETQELSQLLSANEDHFFDIKSKDIAPSKLQETFVAFANADGGDIYIGIEDMKFSGERVRPFSTPEEANAIFSVLLEQTTPAVDNVMVEFLSIPTGYILHVSIPKSPKVHYTASGDCFIRLNAAKHKIKGERITSLAYSKGSLLYEKAPVNSVSLDEISQSEFLSDYMNRVGTSLSAERFLRKQRLTTENDGEVKPNVGCVLLFDEEPQASIDTRCAIKVYRLRTTDTDYKRDHLAEMPSTINGPTEKAIKRAIQKIKDLVDGASFYEGENLVNMQYPAEAIQEVLVNAVIHRDYSLTGC